MMTIRHGFLLLCCVCALLPQAVLAKGNKPFSLSDQNPKTAQRREVLKSLWQTQLQAGSPAKRYAPELSDPVLHDGVIYVGTQAGVLYAVAADTGQKLWEYRNDEPISGRAAVSANAVFFVDLGGHLHAVGKSGEALWQTDLHQEILNPPVLSGDRLYLLKGEKEVACYSAVNGQLIWSTPVNTFTKRLTIRGQAGLLLDGGTVVAALADGQIYGFDAGNGALRWAKPLAPQLSSFKDIDAEIVADGEAYYVAGYFGQVQKLARGSKETLWTLDVGSGVAPLVVQNTVVVADLHGELKAFDKTSAAALWSNELSGSVLSAPVAIGDAVYVSTLKSKGFVVNPATGDIWQDVSLPGGSIARPLVSGDTLFVLGNGGTLAAYQWNP